MKREKDYHKELVIMSQTNNIVNQSLFEEEDQIPTQMMGFIPFPSNLTLPPLAYHHHQSFKPFNTPMTPEATDFAETLLPSSVQKPREDLSSSNMLSSLNRSKMDSWAWGELMDKRSGGDDNHNHNHNHNHNLGVSSMKMKKMKGRRKVREPRFCFKTMSDVDVLDDGYKWRKYGQKVVKNTQHPRSYYRCTQDNCRVKKRVERLAEDPRMVITTYEGRHAHSPSNDLEDSQNPSELCNFFW